MLLIMLFHPRNSNPDWDRQSETQDRNITIAGEQLSRLQTPPKMKLATPVITECNSDPRCHVVPAPSIWTLPQQSCESPSLAWGLVKGRCYEFYVECLGLWKLLLQITNGARNKATQTKHTSTSLRLWGFVVAKWETVERVCSLHSEHAWIYIDYSERSLLACALCCPFIYFSIGVYCFFLFNSLGTKGKGNPFVLISHMPCPHVQSSLKIKQHDLGQLGVCHLGIATTLEMSFQFYVCLCLPRVRAIPAWQGIEWRARLLENRLHSWFPLSQKKILESPRSTKKPVDALIYFPSL